MPGGLQPFLPCGNGGFGHVDGPTDFSQTFKAPSPPRQSLLCPDYLMNALAAKKHAVGTEYCDDEFRPVKKEPNWVGFNNNQETVYTNQVNVENYGGLVNDQFKEVFGDDHNTNLFVGNLPSNCSENALWDLFSTSGDVTDVRIAKKYDHDRQVPGFAFVRFLDPDSVARVLDSKPIKLFGDHRLNVQRQESWKMKRGDDKPKSSLTRRRNDLDSRKCRSRSRSNTRSRRKRSYSRSPRPSHSRRRRSRSRSRRSCSASPVRSRTVIRAPKRRRSRSSQGRSAKRKRGDNSVSREEHRRKLREEREYELERLRHVRRREERLREDERRLRDQMDGGKMREEEEQVRKLKRERLAREKKLHERERSLMRLKEEQESRMTALRRSISRDRTSVERHIRMRSRSRQRSRSRSRGLSGRIKSSSEISSSSRQTSSSRSVFDGNRLGGKISVKTRLGKRRSPSKSRD